MNVSMRPRAVVIDDGVPLLGAMDDPLLVRRLQCIGNLRRDAKYFRHPYRSAGKIRRERFPLDELHDEGVHRLAEAGPH